MRKLLIGIAAMAALIMGAVADRAHAVDDRIYEERGLRPHP